VPAVIVLNAAAAAERDRLEVSLLTAIRVCKHAPAALRVGTMCVCAHSMCV